MTHRKPREKRPLDRLCRSRDIIPPKGPEVFLLAPEVLPETAEEDAA